MRAKKAQGLEGEGKNAAGKKRKKRSDKLRDGWPHLRGHGGD